MYDLADVLESYMIAEEGLYDSIKRASMNGRGIIALISKAIIWVIEKFKNVRRTFNIIEKSLRDDAVSRGTGSKNPFIKKAENDLRSAHKMLLVCIETATTEWKKVINGVQQSTKFLKTKLLQELVKNGVDKIQNNVFMFQNKFEPCSKLDSGVISEENANGFIKEIQDGNRKIDELVKSLETAHNVIRVNLKTGSGVDKIVSPMIQPCKEIITGCNEMIQVYKRVTVHAKPNSVESEENKSHINGRYKVAKSNAVSYYHGRKMTDGGDDHE